MFGSSVLLGLLLAVAGFVAMTWRWPLLGPVTLASLLLVHYVRLARVRSHIRRQLRNRATISESEFGTAYFAGQQAMIASKVRRCFEEQYVGDIGRVRPDDNLYADLALASLDGLDLEVFVADLEELFKIRIADRDAVRFRTLRDVVTCVSANLQSVAASRPGTLNGATGSS
ncbi:MAG: acyl carrier protein [Phycisphaerae bacterium]